MDLQTVIRPMSYQDIAAAMRLKTIAGWNQTEADWRLFLDSNPAGCFVAEHQGQVVGTTTTTDYSGAIAWIGMVLVDPDFRRQGIATRLTRQALERVKPRATVKLDATPLGQQVYEPLGFQTEYIVYRLTIGAMPPVEAASSPDLLTGSGEADRIFPLSPGDLAAVGRFDRPAFDADRLPFLAVWAEAQPRIAWQIRRRGELAGYCLGRVGVNFYQFGPLVAETTAEAIALAGAAFANLAGQPVIIDVPARQTDFLSWLESLGFERQRTFSRMYYRQNRHPGRPEKVFATAGPEVG